MNTHTGLNRQQQQELLLSQLVSSVDDALIDKATRVTNELIKLYLPSVIQMAADGVFGEGTLSKFITGKATNFAEGQLNALRLEVVEKIKSARDNAFLSRYLNQQALNACSQLRTQLLSPSAIENFHQIEECLDQVKQGLTGQENIVAEHARMLGLDEKNRQATIEENIELLKNIINSSLTLDNSGSLCYQKLCLKKIMRKFYCY